MTKRRAIKMWVVKHPNCVFSMLNLCGWSRTIGANDGNGFHVEAIHFFTRRKYAVEYRDSIAKHWEVVAVEVVPEPKGDQGRE